MYESSYYYDTAAMSIMAVYYVIVLAISIITIVALWKLYAKAGKPGWAAIIPFYNQYCLYEIAMGNGWLFLLSFVPCVNIVVTIILQFQLAKAYGQGAGFGFGLLFLNPIFMMILAFGGYEYVGPGGKTVSNPTVVNNNYTINNYNSGSDSNNNAGGNFSGTNSTDSSANGNDDNPYYN